MTNWSRTIVDVTSTVDVEVVKTTKVLVLPTAVRNVVVDVTGATGNFEEQKVCAGA